MKSHDHRIMRWFDSTSPGCNRYWYRLKADFTNLFLYLTSSFLSCSACSRMYLLTVSSSLFPTVLVPRNGGRLSSWIEGTCRRSSVHSFLLAAPCMLKRRTLVVFSRACVCDLSSHALRLLLLRTSRRFFEVLNLFLFLLLRTLPSDDTWVRIL